MEGEAEQEWGVGQADTDGALAGGDRRKDQILGDWRQGERDCLGIVVGVRSYGAENEKRGDIYDDM